jgi:outer membrane protein assembly factor BamB
LRKRKIHKKRRKKEMNTLRNKIAAITISLLFILSISASLTLLPSASAHTPPWQITDVAHINAQPSPIGVGQPETIIFWAAQPLPLSALTNNIRKTNYTLIVTDPDGAVVFDQNFYNIVNPGGEQAIEFVPAKVGTYNATFYFRGMTYPTYDQITSTVPLSKATVDAYAGDIYLPTSDSVTFVVQQEPLSYIINPLPTEYWTRPIENQNVDWYVIASNWLGGNDGASFGGHTLEAVNAPGINVYQPIGTVPLSGHILWTKPQEFGGLVGSNTPINNGTTYYSGDSYEPRFANPIIISGRLYYKQALGHSGNQGDYVCLDLKTGETIWTKTDPSFNPTWGQTIAYSDPNEAGSHGAFLFQAVGSTWRAYDAWTGYPIFNITNVPSGFTAFDSMGSMLIYVINYNTTSDTGWIGQWNATKLIQNPYSPSAQVRVNGQQFNGTGYTVQGNFISPYTWNVTITGLKGLVLNANTATGVQVGGPSINAVVPQDILFGTSSGLSQATGNQYTPNPFTMWAINLNPNNGPIGRVMWVRNYTAPDPMVGNPSLGSLTQRFASLDPINRVAMFAVDEIPLFIGYSVTTGEKLWETDFEYANNAQFFSTASGSGMRPVTAYGRLYIAGYGGEILSFDTTNGNLLWRFGAGGEGNTTEAGLNTPWGLLPTNINVICNGYLIASSFEHGNGALSPYYRGQRIWELNATSGEQIWTIQFQTGNDGGPGYPIGAVADGQFVEYNLYDNQLYNFGQGPTQTTVNAPSVGVTTAAPITITGTVMDVSAGTKDYRQVARFPNGVPVASDASESNWMEYVYMQKAKPTNFTGVTVTLYVLDNNNNYRSIGTTTTNALGDYSYSWTPDISGSYALTAVFAGSNAYYGSSDSTAFYASETVTPAPTSAPPAGLATTADLMTFIVGGVIAIIVAVAIATVLILRKRP